jgi:hypothetical protein
MTIAPWPNSTDPLTVRRFEMIVLRHAELVLLGARRRRAGADHRDVDQAFGRALSPRDPRRWLLARARRAAAPFEFRKRTGSSAATTAAAKVCSGGLCSWMTMTPFGPSIAVGKAPPS